MKGDLDVADPAAQGELGGGESDSGNGWGGLRSNAACEGDSMLGSSEEPFFDRFVGFARSQSEPAGRFFGCAPEGFSGSEAHKLLFEVVWA